MDHFGPKVNGPFWTSKLQIQSKDIFKFCLLKEAKKHMKIIIIFSKFGLGQMGHVDLHSKLVIASLNYLDLLLAVISGYMKPTIQHCHRRKLCKNQSKI